MSGPGFALAVGLAFVHAFVSKLNVVSFIPEFRWMSFAGGVSISYVFLEIFPELSHAQEVVEHSQVPIVAYFENHVYLLSLLGLLVFYGLDILALKARQQRIKSSYGGMQYTVFWIHLAAFTVLNTIVGYLLQEMANHTLVQCLLFFAAVALHFFVVDHGMREHYHSPYDKYGCWVLTAAVMLGAIAGQVFHFNEASILMIWSFLAGSIILNILKRELPDEQKSCFGSFTVGAGLYTILLLLA
ncbi:MAG: hypothetical protein AAGI69_04920 [Cyanobacteria bacterium P01_H01_bin.21]